MEKSYTARENDKVAFKIVAAIFGLFMAIAWFFLFVSLNDMRELGEKTAFLSLMLMGVLIIYISNLMPKVKQNSVLGIRTTATLKNETVWRKTHKFAGYMGVISGGIIIVFGIMCFFIEANPLLLLMIGCGIAIVLFSIVPCIYASVLYKKLTK